jgi:hypothetical protein
MLLQVIELCQPAGSFFFEPAKFDHGYIALTDARQPTYSVPITLGFLMFKLICLQSTWTIGVATFPYSLFGKVRVTIEPWLLICSINMLLSDWTHFVCLECTVKPINQANNIFAAKLYLSSATKSH